MNCIKVMDMVYDEDSSLLNQIQISFHTFFCPSCAQKIELYQAAREIMKNDFFQLSPDIENQVMARISCEEELSETESSFSIPGVLSTRGWVIAGLIIMISLVTAFFGLDFKNLVSQSGNSFLLPMGITIGIVLTSYCALFIGSHLKELSERFGL